MGVGPNLIYEAKLLLECKHECIARRFDILTIEFHQRVQLNLSAVDAVFGLFLASYGSSKYSGSHGPSRFIYV